MRQLFSKPFSILLFPVVLFYYECVFRLSTGGAFLQLGSVFTALVCIALGLLCYGLCTIPKGETARRIWAACISGVFSIPFLVEYFIFKQFKLFYDLATTFGGAADAVTGFTKDIYILIFSWDGALKIGLFLLPTVLILLLGKRLGLPARCDWKWRTAALLLCGALLGLGRLGVSFSEPLSLLISSQYSFQQAVSQFGLLSGIGLDFNHSLTGDQKGGFEQVELPVIPVTTPAPTPPPSTAPEGSVSEQTTPAATEPPVIYVPNQLDIDFSALTTDGKLGELNAYVSSLTPTMTNEYTGLFRGKNLILITAEAFCGAVIDPELTPTLYRMATKGIQFTDYYQPSGSGTTGGEYQAVFGMVPTDSGMSFKNTADNNNYFTMGSQLDRLGYWGRAYHNNLYTFYSRHETHINLGYSEGFLGFGNGIEAYVTDQWPRSDLEMFAGSLPEYIGKQPFNAYYMTVSGHSGYTMGANCMSVKHWDRVKHLPYSDLVKAYLASQMELEDSMAFLIAELEAAGIADDTVICITGDHFPYGLTDSDDPSGTGYLSELYGHRVYTTMEKDKSALIIWSGCLEKMDPIIVDSPTFSLDILPTLSNLFGTAYDSRLLPGRDVFSEAEPLVFNMEYDWKTMYGIYENGHFEPSSPELEIPDGYIKAVSAIVRNKIRYCKGVLDEDYFGYLFGSTQPQG